MTRRNALPRLITLALSLMLIVCGAPPPGPEGDTGPHRDATQDSASDTLPPLPDGFPPGDGNCTIDCSPGQICRNGQCYAACYTNDDCTSDRDCCDNACVHLAVDANHCTRCGNSCFPHGDTCRDGRCACPGNGYEACHPPFHCCGSSGCVDVETDPNHCGGCYASCPGDCIDGYCNTCTEDQHDRNGRGNTLNEAVSLGNIEDRGQDVSVRGNLYPDGDQDCFRFTAVDLTPTNEQGTCGAGSVPGMVGDRFHVDIRFRTNPDHFFALQVYRGGPLGGECLGETYGSYSWGTAFRDTSQDPPAGQCPCRLDAVEHPPAVRCTDDTAEFLFCVVKAPGRADQCVGYEIAVSNGLYPTEVD